MAILVIPQYIDIYETLHTFMLCEPRPCFYPLCEKLFGNERFVGVRWEPAA